MTTEVKTGDECIASLTDIPTCTATVTQFVDCITAQVVMPCALVLEPCTPLFSCAL